ncbi:hypothetical protein BH09BAC1_BH09BAC1_13920 [soil metagenome]
MKALFIMLFVGFGWCAMAQQTGGGNVITFDSPEPTVKSVEGAQGQVNQKDRLVIVGAEPQLVQVKTDVNAVTKPRIEFNSPEAQGVGTGKRDDK